MSDKGKIILEVRELYKNFGATVAVDNVSFVLERGKIYGLIGENGSGKSTISSIIAGIQPQTRGKMFYDGEPFSPRNPIEAAEKGIGIVVQEAGTIPSISVAENILLGEVKKYRKGIVVDRRAMRKEAQRALDKVGIKISPDTFTNNLDMQERKLVEIAKVMKTSPEIIIIDETTTALSQEGRAIIYRIMHESAESDKCVMFISHDLEEIMEHSDHLLVLRDGVLVKEIEKKDFEPNLIKKSMVGRDLQEQYYVNDEVVPPDEIVLKADCITTMRDILCLSLELKKGEVLGIGGISDCGMHTLGRALFGLEKIVDGELILPNKNNIMIKSSTQAYKNGMGYVSKNRDTESLDLNAPIYDNIASTGFDLNKAFSGFISFNKEKKYVNKEVGDLSIKCQNIYQQVRYLSGGNKQKVVFGKWIAYDADILILDCPTRGVDIGVKADMYQLIYNMKKKGKSIIMISEELPELVGMSDRLIIMKNGKIAGEFNKTDGFDEHTLIDYMI